MAFDWNEANLKSLREMWALGLSTRDIGKHLGCTKNAVVGKVHRLDLPARPSPVYKQERLAEMRAIQRPEVERLLREGYGIDRIRTAVRVAHEYVAQVRDELGLGYAKGARKPLLARVERRPGTSGYSYDAAARQAPKPAARPVIVAPPQPRYAPRKLPGVDACCWPFGEPGTRSFRFCDSADVQPGKPYCKAHCKDAYVRSIGVSSTVRHYTQFTKYVSGLEPDYAAPL
jgi:GcrA cell cycle regulator